MDFEPEADLEKVCASSAAETAFPQWRTEELESEAPGCSTGFRQVSGDGCLSCRGWFSTSLLFLRFSFLQFIFCASDFWTSIRCSLLPLLLPLPWSMAMFLIFSPCWAVFACTGSNSVRGTSLLILHKQCKFIKLKIKNPFSIQCSKYVKRLQKMMLVIIQTTRTSLDFVLLHGYW